MFKHSYKKLYKPSAWFILTCDHPPRQPPEEAQPCGPGMGSCLKRFCPRGRGAWQLKNNWYLLRLLDIDDVKHKNKNIETIPSRFFREQKTMKSFILRHLCSVHEVLTK